MATNDPLLWTVNKVADITRNLHEVVSNTPDSLRSAQETLAQAFKDNEVDGQTLLTVIDFRSMQEDLGVTSFPLRSRVATMIKMLQAQSEEYRKLFGFSSVHGTTGSGTGSSSEQQEPAYKRRKIIQTLKHLQQDSLKEHTESGPYASNPLHYQGIVKRCLSLKYGRPSEGSLPFPPLEPQYLALLARCKNARYADSVLEGEHESETNSEERLSEMSEFFVPPEPQEQSSNDVDDELEAVPLQPSRATVTQIIDDMIEQYVQTWHDVTKPQLEARQGLKLRNAGTPPKELIKLAQKQLRLCNTRLTQMKKDLMSQEWDSCKQLRDMCEILQPTVALQELEVWRRSIWQAMKPSHDTEQSQLGVKKAAGPSADPQDHSTTQQITETTESTEEAPTVTDRGPAAAAPPALHSENLQVNLDKKINEAAVYLRRNQGLAFQQHQVDGVRFLWDIITTEGGQGCLLAHIMGLGKTAQVVALLQLLQEAGKDTLARAQVPRELRKPKVLVLCPPSLISNWVHEIKRWSGGPNYFQTFVMAYTGDTRQKRLDVLANWTRLGGILILGYQMFSGMLKNGENLGNMRLGPAELAKAKQALLREAKLVVADEAHTMNNPDSAISKAANQILTERRVALTGTPISNNTQEIFSIINWVAPGYLGTASAFDEIYKKPIEAGNYSNSTYAEKRKSLQTLEMLHRKIAPKMNRADHSVLNNSLPPMTEFVLTLPLTQLQSLAYGLYVEALQIATDSDERLFAWVSILGLLCCHPKVFRDRLEPPSNTAEAISQTNVQSAEPSAETLPASVPTPTLDSTLALTTAAGIDEDMDVVDGDHNLAAANELLDKHVDQLGISREMIDQIIPHLPTTFDINDSFRTALVQQIIALSKNAGDKVLIFSQRLPTLDCLQNMLEGLHVKFARIDGKTKMKTRMGILQEFNADKHDVLLISTKAGGQGLNMQKGNRVILFDFGHNPTWEEQAIGRAYRIGQDKPVYVYRFVAGGTFETTLYSRSMFKKALFDKVVDKKNPRAITEKRVQWLRAPGRVAQEDVWTAEGGRDPKVLGQIVGQLVPGTETSIRAIQTMDTLGVEAGDEPLTAEELSEVEKALKKK